MRSKLAILNRIEQILTEYNCEIKVTIDDLEIDEDKGEITLTNKVFRDSNDNIEKETYNDKIHKFIHEKSKSKKADSSTYYHFIKPDFGLQLLKNKKFQFSSLSSLWQNDPLEFTEFDRRTRLSYSIEPSKLKSIKERIFILCLTKEFDSPKFWETYGRNDNSLCIGLKFSHTQHKRLSNLCHMRDMIYDNGYDFDFLIELKQQLLLEFNLKLVYEGVLHFGKFYKRGKFHWEQETRICFDYRINDIALNFFRRYGFSIEEGTNLREQFPIEHSPNDGRYFINVPFENDFFTTEVEEIIVGANVSLAQKKMLKNFDLKITYRN